LGFLGSMNLMSPARLEKKKKLLAIKRNFIQCND
jgi:hypothetical protein